MGHDVGCVGDASDAASWTFAGRERRRKGFRTEKGFSQWWGNRGDKGGVAIGGREEWDGERETGRSAHVEVQI